MSTFIPIVASVRQQGSIGKFEDVEFELTLFGESEEEFVNEALSHLYLMGYEVNHLTIVDF